MDTSRVSNVYSAIQKGLLKLDNARAGAEPGSRLLDARLEEMEFDPPNLKVSVALYVQGSYKDVLRRLETEQLMTPAAVILKILCLLKLAQKKERVAAAKPVEYLRDKILPQLKQVEHSDDAGTLRQLRDWLERYCLGHELPDKFWGSGV